MALTKASFKVSDLISDLALREKIKHQVLEVYKTFLIDSGNQSSLLKEIDILNHYFYLGGHLNLIKDEHLKQLRNGFLVFKSHIILAADENKKFKKHDNIENENVENSVSNNLSAKQKKVIEKFDSKDTLKLAEIMELFPGVSERTIRNELTSLINLGKITRDGRGNGSFYKIIVEND